MYIQNFKRATTPSLTVAPKCLPIIDNTIKNVQYSCVLVYFDGHLGVGEVGMNLPIPIILFLNKKYICSLIFH